MPLMSIEEYRQRAQECDHLAERATSPDTRETMQYMASRWRALADGNVARDRRAKPLQRTRPQPHSE
jgi:hypothetical protein